MAEDGYDFENPEFDRDDYDDDIDDLDDKLPLVPDEPTQRIISNQSKTLKDLRGELRESGLEDQKQRLVKTFFGDILERYKIGPLKIEYSQYSISDVGKILFWVVDDKKIDLLQNKDKQHFFSLGTLASEYNNIVGHYRAQAVRKLFDIQYKSKRQVRPKTVAALNKVVEKANNAVKIYQYSTFHQLLMFKT